MVYIKNKVATLRSVSNNLEASEAEFLNGQRLAAGETGESVTTGSGPTGSGSTTSWKTRANQSAEVYWVQEKIGMQTLATKQPTSPVQDFTPPSKSRDGNNKPPWAMQTKSSQHNTPSITGTAMSPISILAKVEQRHCQNKNPQSSINKEDRVFHRRPAAESAVGKTLNRNTNSCSSLGCQTDRCQKKNRN